MRHQLYHGGDLVLFTHPSFGVYAPTPAYVVQVVESGKPTFCPHCGSQVLLRTTVQRYGYYLDWEPPYDCCVPLTYNQLKRAHSVSNQPYKFINGEITHE